jgi:hypothetical protein
MKAGRRHELQTNILSVKLARFADFARRHSNHIAWGVLGVAVVVLGIYFIYQRQSAKADERQMLLDRCMADPQGNIKDLESLAGQTSDKQIAALSCVALGDVHARRALLARTEAERSGAMDEATRWYRKTIDEFGKYPVAVGKARFGLAKIYEGQRKWSAAESEYQEIRRMTALSGYPVLAFAEEALTTLASRERASEPRLATTRPAPEPSATTTSGPADATTGPGAESRPVSAPSGEPAPTTQAKPSSQPPVRVPRATTQPAG